MVSVAVPVMLGVLSEVGSGDRAVSVMLGAVASYVANVMDMSESVEVAVVSLVDKDTWYCIYLSLSVTQELPDISAPDDMAVHEPQAVAPLMSELESVRTFTETVVLAGVVAVYVSVPHAAPAVYAESKIEEVIVPAASYALVKLKSSTTTVLPALTSTPYSRLAAAPVSVPVSLYHPEPAEV